MARHLPIVATNAPALLKFKKARLSLAVIERDSAMLLSNLLNVVSISVWLLDSASATWVAMELIKSADAPNAKEPLEPSPSVPLAFG